LIALYRDPLKKREEFSVSLRKKKKDELIKSKRTKVTMKMFSPPDDEDLVSTDSSEDQFIE